MQDTTPAAVFVTVTGTNTKTMRRTQDLQNIEGASDERYANTGNLSDRFP